MPLDTATARYSITAQKHMHDTHFIPFHSIPFHYQTSSISDQTSQSTQALLTMANLLNRTIVINMNIQPLGLEIHSLHHARLEHAVFLGEIGFGECLAIQPMR